jgi:3D (Asp-Asp-Asp) domain-containing protein
MSAGLLNSGNLISEKKVEVKNLNQTKNSVALTKVLEYDTVKTYNSSLPTGTTKTKEEGHTGLAYTDENNNNLEVIDSPKNAEVEIGTGEKADYVGKMTGYGADCAGCSKTGTLACKTKYGYHSLVNDGMNYNDDTYGSVRIIAASLDKFPCGTIIEVNNPNLGVFKAIVLDTGSAMQNDWKKGIVHMDLAYTTESDPAISLATSSNVNYSVLRWGF